MLDPTTADAIARAYGQLHFMPEDIFEVHGFAFWPLSSPSEERISTGKSGSRSPGQGDGKARGAYTMVAQELAHAYESLFLLGFEESIEIPRWPGANSLIPIMSSIPSPSELAKGCGIIATSMVRLAEHGEKLAVHNEKGRLISGACYYIQRAHNALTGASNKTNTRKIEDILKEHKDKWSN